MDDAEREVKRPSARGVKPPDDAVLTTANRRSSGSGRTNSGSARTNTASARVAPAPAPVASASSSKRGAVAPIKKKKPPMPVKELIIAGVAVVLLAGTAITVYVVKNSERAKVNKDKDEQKNIFESNVKLGKDAMDKAIKVGTLYMVGKVEAGFDEKSLFAPFKDDPKIFNVAYDRTTKDRRQQDVSTSKKMYEDSDHYNVVKLNNTKEFSPDLVVSYGWAQGKTIPVVVATKVVKPNQGDLVNLGGVITVVVKADEDDFFKKARNVDLPKVEEKKAPVPEVKAPAVNEAKTPAETKK